MGQMTVRNIPDRHYAALKRVAAANNRSAEAEARLAIARHVGAEGEEGVGSRLAAKYRGLAGPEFELARDRTASDPLSFE